MDVLSDVLKLLRIGRSSNQFTCCKSIELLATLDQSVVRISQFIEELCELLDVSTDILRHFQGFQLDYVFYQESLALHLFLRRLLPPKRLCTVDLQLFARGLFLRRVLAFLVRLQVVVVFHNSY